MHHMKTISGAVLFLAVVPTVSFPQSIPLPEQGEKQRSQIDQMSREIQALQRAASAEKQLEERIRTASEALEIHSTVFSGFEAYLAIVGIFLGVISLAVPIGAAIFTYLQAIKPARAALARVARLERKLQARLLRDVNDFLANREHERVEQALAEIEGAESTSRNEALMYLSLNQHYKFSEPQLLRIYGLLRLSPPLDDYSRQVLTMLLSGRVSRFADDYFRSSIDPNPQFGAHLFYAIKYISIRGPEPFMDRLRDFVLNTANHSQNLLLLVSHLRNFAPTYVTAILNDAEISDRFDPASLQSCRRSIEALFKNQPNTPDLSATRFFKRTTA